MINFTIKILQYSKDSKGFLVEYTPDLSLSPPCTVVTQNFVLGNLTAETTPDEIYKILSELSPQQFWQEQIDASKIPFETFEAMVGGERGFNAEDFVAPEDAIASDPNTIQITPEMEREFKDIEMEAAIQRVLGRLSGERV